MRYATFLLMVALKFYIQHLCRAISIWAANAIEVDSSLSVMKVEFITRSLRGLAS